MNNEKDNQKTGLNSYGQVNVLDVKALGSRHVYEFANKKTEKLVTALYMVTDCMETDDALKAKLRELGVELLSDMHKLSNLKPEHKQLHISTSLARVDEILSFVEIAYTVGFISEMNTMILKKEFGVLTGELLGHQNKDKHFTFTLDEEMFSLPVLPEQNSQINDKNMIKDKRTNFNNMSFTNSVSRPSLGQNSVARSHLNSVPDKQERTNKILSLIKDISGADTSKEVSIKDISIAFTDCSEKTIQRELNSLVLKGQIKKTGSKRWSRYQAVIKN